MFDHEWLTEKQMRSLNFGRNSRCQFTIHFPLYSRKIPTKLLCKGKCLKISIQCTKPVSPETNFSAICCEQKFFCVSMIDTPLGVCVGCHFQSSQSMGSAEAPLGGRVGCQFSTVPG